MAKIRGHNKNQQKSGDTVLISFNINEKIGIVSPDFHRISIGIVSPDFQFPQRGKIGIVPPDFSERSLNLWTFGIISLFRNDQIAKEIEERRRQPKDMSDYVFTLVKEPKYESAQLS